MLFLYGLAILAAGMIIGAKLFAYIVIRVHKSERGLQIKVGPGRKETFIFTDLAQFEILRELADDTLALYAPEKDEEPSIEEVQALESKLSQSIARFFHYEASQQGPLG